MKTFRFSLAFQSLFSLMILNLLLVFPALLPAQVYNGNLSLTSQAAVNAFSYTEVTGYLYIQGNDITNLDGLISLDSVGGDLYITSNNLLTNIDGLSSLNSVGGNLLISGNNSLTNLAGLYSLTSVGGFLIMESNISLLNVAGLSSLTSVGEYFEISYSNLLVNVDGLSSLTSVGGLAIYSCGSLTNLDGLSSLTSVGASLGIFSNGSLTNLDGLTSLTSVGGLSIRYNPNLSGFCGLYPLLNGGGLGGSYLVTNNFDNPTQQDIIAGGPCGKNPTELINDLVANGTLNQGQANALLAKLNSCRLLPFNNQVNAFVNAGIMTQAEADDLILAADQTCNPPTRTAVSQTFALGQNYPNPVSGYTVVPFTLPTSSKVSLNLYDASGRLVRNLLDQDFPAGNHEIKVNLQSLPAGTYFGKFQAGQNVETMTISVE
ncbi:MAG: T9SS type A sorting domain-containing protein [Bacteroidetes bacterium]|nr:T9SS type A sorting domain-containing protein [Bacteroidota bacterium]